MAVAKDFNGIFEIVKTHVIQLKMLITKSNLTCKPQQEEQVEPRPSDPDETPRIPRLESLKIDMNPGADCRRVPPNVTYSCTADISRAPVSARDPESNKNIYSKIFKHDNFWVNTKVRRENFSIMNYCVLSVHIAFLFGLLVGVLLLWGTSKENSTEFLVTRPEKYVKPFAIAQHKNESPSTLRTLNSINEMSKQLTINDLDTKPKLEEAKGSFSSVSFTGGLLKHFEEHKIVNNREIYPKGMTEDMKDILKDNKNIRRHDVRIILNSENKTNITNENTIIYENIYWGPQVENSLPRGYDEISTENWEHYVKHSEVVKMESGCGRMQNRLVTFTDGLQACVRYRQNTDQIQGEIFSFYVARLLNLTNLAPSTISVVDLKDRLWQNVASDIASAQWNTNRAVVLTQYIPSLESAPIPEAFKPSERHLNKFDVLKMALKDNDTDSKTILIDKLKKYQNTIKSGDKKTTEAFDHVDMDLTEKTLKSFLELAQWSDLIVFDYLTANLDRIVNNLFNFQWNVNIMDGPAHNLARKADSGLLMFLDNESGLLHGYRLLKKYNVYHSLMLDNLCVFRSSTIHALKQLHADQSVGLKLHDMFRSKNNAVIRDILPPLPEKNVKILYERIGKVLSQVQKCEQSYAKR